MFLLRLSRAMNEKAVMLHATGLPDISISAC